MLRNLALAFLGLSLLVGPAAARGSDGPTSGRSSDAKVSRGAKAKQPPQQASPLLRQVMATTTVRPVASSAIGAGTCGRSSRGQASRCRGAQLASSSRWARGLPPALGVQAQQCPPGTMATLAEGHDDIVRCIPV
ncbi:hypothetical protein GCM10009416_26400 [Craurococcus roseus]|uniref:Uncharacterized protein n=1 Tax=Craurococcus roseus TaxID=77585 RepID=A0ABN1FAN7_9PROT